MSVHKSVLLEEAIESLKLKNGDIAVDATLGGGGHSRAILRGIGESGILVGIDSDKDAIDRFKFPISNFQFPKKLQIANSKYKIQENIYLVNDNFTNLENILADLKIEKVSAILADFGISSDQLEGLGRGFSFQRDEALDMRVSLRNTNLYETTNKDGGLTAANIVNSYPEKDLIRIFREYGEEQHAGKIAKRIVEYRKKKPIETTKELATIIEKSVPEKYKHQRINFATKVFQALRIEVNRELENIEKFIPKAIECLNKNGRLAVITFHSGEDRLIKKIFRENARGCICPPNFPVCQCGIEPKVRIIAKKPIAPSEKEIKENPRSRSAKLRVVEKL